MWARFRIALARLILPEITVFGVTQNSSLLFLFAKDNAITPASLACGSFQKETLANAISLIEQHKPLKRRLFLDIGANIGTSTLQAVLDHGFQRAISFEPVPANLQLLRSNLAASAISERCRIEAYGLSDAKGTASMALSSVNHGDHRIDEKLAGDLKKRANWSHSVEITVTTVDSYFEDYDPDIEAIDLIWIDTQGHEQPVLKGAQKTLVRTKAPVIFEVWPWALVRLGRTDQMQALFPQEIYTTFYDVGAKDLSPRTLESMTSYLGTLPNYHAFNTDFLVI